MSWWLEVLYRWCPPGWRLARWVMVEDDRPEWRR